MKIGSFIKKNFLLLCETYEIVPENIPRLFRMTIDESALTLFDAHFEIDHTNWTTIDNLFTQRYDSTTKQEEVSDELTALKLEDFKNEKNDDKEALSKLVDRIAKLYQLSIPSDRNEAMQKRFLQRAVSGKDWALHADKQASTVQSYHGYVDSLFSAIRTVSRHNERKG